MSDYSILSQLSSPDDLKKLPESELPKLCEEIRQKLVEVVSENGGHLASNLGVVELTIALHRSFKAPFDSIVWDVGHQSYTHKMLTGRYSKIETIRTKGGLSGFPKRNESKYDDFNAGHSSTSISAAFGMAKAKQIKGEKSHTVAVIGDASFTGGMALEGFNNAGRYSKKFIVVLNDNKMSIGKNVGAFAKYLTRVRVNPWYLRLKNKIERVLLKIPIVGKWLIKLLAHSTSKVKKIAYRDTIFDNFGFTYFGPINGHDIDELERAFEAAKKLDAPVLIHVVTKKGKGYEYAEKDPKTFHGINRFDIITGESPQSKESFSSVFGEYMCQIASKDRRICAITAAMKPGVGLNDFSIQYKDRFFDVGIAEEHAVTFAAGLACKGMVPVFAVYSTFLQRAYDQLLHDVAMQKLHVVIAIDRAGIVGDDGETHQGVFDVSMLNSLPNTTIYSPCYFDGLKKCLNEAVYHTESLVAVRYPRGGELYRPENYLEASVDFDFYGSKDCDTLIVTYGRLFSNCCEAKKKLIKNGKEVCVLKLNQIKPLPEKAVCDSLVFKDIHFYEEGMMNGSIAYCFNTELTRMGYAGKVNIHAIDDVFVDHQTVSQALKELCFDSESIVKDILEIE
ncbi:MAG: 1-deoxy-D-xylulose-5-phosphate synthase [Ruminococcus sp.]|nr:1-deoxy-D-xylulose-5-phosphate synthase [Ruminococcus sp.]